MALYATALSAADMLNLSNDAPEQVTNVGRGFYLPLDTSTSELITVEPLATNTLPLTVGRDQSDANPVRGLIDELSVWDTPLPASEVQRLMGRAPVLNLALDEFVGATTFTDSAAPQSGSCAAPGCPQAGSELGRIRTAPVFDGTDTISVPDRASLNLDTFTVELWVRPTAVQTTTTVLLAKSDASGGAANYLVRTVNNSLRLQLQACGAGYTSVRSLNQDQWNHLAATYDGARLSLYLNGTLDGSVAAGACPHPSQPLRLGQLPSYGRGFDGLLDELRIYNYALRGAEI